MGGSKRRNKKTFYAVVTSYQIKIFEVWDDCLIFMKGKKKVKQKGFTDRKRKDAEEFIKTHTKQDKSSSDDSMIGEDKVKDSQEQHISEHHIVVKKKRNKRIV